MRGSHPEGRSPSFTRNPRTAQLRGPMMLGEARRYSTSSAAASFRGAAEEARGRVSREKCLLRVEDGWNTSLRPLDHLFIWKRRVF